MLLFDFVVLAQHRRELLIVCRHKVLLEAPEISAECLW
jgi:hypothetical protein